MSSRAKSLSPVASSSSKPVRQYHPKWLAILGIGAYQQAFGIKSASIGPQPRTIGSTRIWLLPNPSGLNAHYTVPRLAEVLAELKRASDQ